MWHAISATSFYNFLLYFINIRIHTCSSFFCILLKSEKKKKKCILKQETKNRKLKFFKIITIISLYVLKNIS